MEYKFEDDKIILTWEDVERLVDRIVDNIDFPVKKIVGVSRGGLIPGVLLSHKLDVPFEPVLWQTRDGSECDIYVLVTSNDPETLVIDDLIDSGRTLHELKHYASDCKFGALFNKKDDIELDICGDNLYNVPNWIVFPWEKK